MLQQHCMALWGLYTTHRKAPACRHSAISEGVDEIISMTKTFSPPGIQLCVKILRNTFSKEIQSDGLRVALRLLQLFQLDYKENRKMQGTKENSTILWARYNYSEIKAGCKKFQLPFKQFSLRYWGTHSVTNRHAISICQSNAVVTAKKKNQWGKW